MAGALCLPAQCFVQEGVTLQTANIMLDSFNIVFGPRIMSNRYLDCHNCGKFGQLSALFESFCLPFLSFIERYASVKPSKETEMRVRFAELCGRAEEDMFHCTIMNLSSTSRAY